MTSPFMRRTSADGIICGVAGAGILICCVKAGALDSGPVDSGLPVTLLAGMTGSSGGGWSTEELFPVITLLT